MIDRDFAQRLARACDDSKIVPEYGKGRQVFLAKKLKVTQEAVRRWFIGESRPRVKIMSKLAELLEVDEAWLSLGVEPDMPREEKRFFDRQTEGVMYLSLGIAMLGGAACAAPSEKDPKRGYVDYYEILNGTQMAVHNSLGREVSDGMFEFLVPHEYTTCKNVGFVHRGGTRIHILDLRHELVNKHKQSKGGGYAITISAKGSEYFTGRDEWPRINNIGELT